MTSKLPEKKNTLHSLSVRLYHIAVNVSRPGSELLFFLFGLMFVTFLAFDFVLALGRTKGLINLGNINVTCHQVLTECPLLGMHCHNI